MGLQLRLRPRARLVELDLAGDLDLTTAPRLEAAMWWLRARYHRTIVLDTRRLDFVDLHGYRALRAALDADDDRGPRTIYVVGDVLARFQHHLAAAIDAATAMGQNGSGRSVPTS
jgi:anti-anti-sigma regulatory factor